MPEKYCNLQLLKTIRCWDEAIPLGNGFMGALIWGPPEALRFSIDRTDLWDTQVPEPVDEKEFCYENMVRLAREGQEAEIRRIFDAPYNRPLPSKLPAGKIVLDTKGRTEVKGTLDITRAQAVMEIGQTKIRSFIHAQKRIGLIRIESPEETEVSIENPEYGIRGNEGKETSHIGSSLKRLKYPAPYWEKNEDWQWFIQEISPIFRYGIFLKVCKGRDGCEIAYATGTSADGPEWIEDAVKSIDEALAQGYEDNFKEHCAWWHQYWEKSSVTLPDKWMEKNWYLANYLFASCSRKGCYPMPLQGVWTADDGNLPPWKGDYHMDLNLQMSYYHYLKANHMEEGESLLDYLWDMTECGRRFARQFYGVNKGMCLPAVMTIDGKALGGWGMYALSPTNQIWLCQAFERHYRFSGNRVFLKEKAYPYMRETAEFILEILQEKDGGYVLPVSSSPEIHDDRMEAFVTPNSNYDLSLLWYLFRELAVLSKDLGFSETERWEAVLQKLPGLSINERKVLMLSPDESLEESHRHMSHLMAIHPLRLISYQSKEEREIIDACLLDLERLGKGSWVGFSFTWAAELYAIQKNGNAAAHQLTTFWKHLCSPNGFHLNGDYKSLGITCMHYRPFTLEANFCAADVLQEMLLQTENGMLDFFPAIPDSWKEENISFTRLRAERGLLVSAGLERGQITSICMEKGDGGGIRIRKSPMLAALAGKYEWEQEENCYWISGRRMDANFVLSGQKG